MLFLIEFDKFSKSSPEILLFDKPKCLIDLLVNKKLETALIPSISRPILFHSQNTLLIVLDCYNELKISLIPDGPMLFPLSSRILTFYVVLKNLANSLAPSSPIYYSERFILV